MDIEFDPTKDAENIRRHGISLQRAEDFDFDAAEYRFDDREDYGEIRYKAVSFLDGSLYSLTFTQREEIMRAISLRTATRQDHREYAEVR